MTQAWVVIIPVKAATRGKSRLDVPGMPRADLARAIALDTISAAVACTRVVRVIVVTSDPEMAVTGAEVVDDSDTHGLDEAVSLGAAIAGDGMPRAALLGDLPALRADDLAEALRLASLHDRGVVADAEDSGSTLVTAAAGLGWASAFGAGSLRRHLALGCVRLDVPADSGLRRDVDTAAQLEQAARRGLGSRTATLLSARAAIAGTPLRSA